MANYCWTNIFKRTGRFIFNKGADGLTKPNTEQKCILQTLPQIFFKGLPWSWTKYCRQVHEFKYNRFFIKCFTADFLQILSQLSEFVFWVTGCVLGIGWKHSRDFLQIFYFPTTLWLQLLANSWGNSYIHILVVII